MRVYTDMAAQDVDEHLRLERVREGPGVLLAGDAPGVLLVAQRGRLGVGLPERVGLVKSVVAVAAQGTGESVRMPLVRQ